MMTDVIAELDSQIGAISIADAESRERKKQLASETRAWKKMLPEDDKDKMLPLLKSYQEEIDKLTKRAKATERCVLDLFKKLSEKNADVAPSVAAAPSEEVQHLREENGRLKGEIKANEEEFSKLSNQDVTIRRLEKEIESLKKESAENVDKALAEREEDMFQKTESQLKEVESQREEYERKVEEAKAQTRDWQSKAERLQEELFELRSAADEMAEGHRSEMDIIGEDLQTARNEISDLKRALEEAKRRSPAGSALSPMMDQESLERDRERVLHLEDELIRRKETEESLKLEITREKQRQRDLIANHHKEVLQKEEELAASKKEVFQLNSQLKKRPSVEEFEKLKKQIRLLQSGDDLEDTSEAEADTDGEFSGTKLMRGRIRKLENTSATLRVQLDEAKTALELAQQSKLDTEERLQDLERSIANERKSTNQMDASDGNDSGAAGFMLAATQGASSSTEFSSVKGNRDSSFVQILSKQRNDFRNRMLELESERDSLLKQCRENKQNHDALADENEELKEKIRYMSSFPSKQQPLDSSHRMNANQRGEVRIPFESHSYTPRRARRRFNGRNPTHAATLKCANFFLSNKYARIFIIVYGVALHLLVFFSMVSSTQQLADLEAANERGLHG